MLVLATMPVLIPTSTLAFTISMAQRSTLKTSNDFFRPMVTSFRETPNDAGPLPNLKLDLSTSFKSNSRPPLTSPGHLNSKPSLRSPLRAKLMPTFASTTFSELLKTLM